MDQANVLRNRIKLKEAKEAYDDTFKQARVITVTSGKGGVGKSNFALNLAINLSKINKKVIIVDADFGLANLEVLFGEDPKYTLRDIFSGDKTIDEIILDGPLNTKIISGGSGFIDMANLKDSELAYVIRSFAFLDNYYDYIIIDTSAGVGNSVVKIIKASKETIIIVTPEPTSIKDAFAIIKSIKENNDISISIVVNRSEDEKEAIETFENLSKMANNFLNVKINYLGYIKEDKELIRAVKSQKPVLLMSPNCDFSKSIYRITNNILNIEQEEVMANGIMSYMKRLVSMFKEVN